MYRMLVHGGYIFFFNYIYTLIHLIPFSFFLLARYVKGMLYVKSPFFNRKEINQIKKRETVKEFKLQGFIFCFNIHAYLYTFFFIFFAQLCIFIHFLHNSHGCYRFHLCLIYIYKPALFIPFLSVSLSLPHQLSLYLYYNLYLFYVFFFFFSCFPGNVFMVI